MEGADTAGGWPRAAGGIGASMATENGRPDLDDVMVPTEHPHSDHCEHAKVGKHVDDDELQHRTEHERDLVTDGRADLQ